MGKKVLIFGDIGIDDTMAILYGYLNNEIEIVGIVADYGNVTKEKAVANVQYVSSLLNSKEVENVSIIGGAELPMTGEVPNYFPEIHGEYGLGPIIPPEHFQEGNVLENLFEVVNIINEYDDLTIVNIGRLTSLATMFILYGNLMQKVNEYYIMGGAFWVPGNVTAVSEANFYGDPIAANIVFTNAKNVSIIPLNVTEHAIATPQMVDYIDQTAQGPGLVKPLLDYYYNFYKERNPEVLGSPLHDVLTLMAVINDNLLTYHTLPVHIIQSLNDSVRGQSIADIRPFTDLEKELPANSTKHRIALNLNYQVFFMDFMSVMTGERFNI
ncbi:MAG TPA: nucleoside hydrolase [Pseudogracilibacillus sp.]|nr:nucleoside hydrolase [Pseudogracilibacillus sp.]